MDPQLFARTSITGWMFLLLLIFAVVSGSEHSLSDLLIGVKEYSLAAAIAAMLSSPVIGWVIGTMSIAVCRLWYGWRLPPSKFPESRSRRWQHFVKSGPGRKALRPFWLWWDHSSIGHEHLTQVGVSFKKNVADKQGSSLLLSGGNIEDVNSDVVFSCFAYSKLPEPVVEYMRRLLTAVAIARNFVCASILAIIFGFTLDRWSLSENRPLYLAFVALTCALFIVRAINVRKDFENAQEIALGMYETQEKTQAKQ